MNAVALTATTTGKARIRAGKTLIELSVVVVITAVIMMLAAVTMTTLFRVKAQFTGDTAQDVSIARLASRLRTDAHGAVAATVADGCSLALADGRSIHYAFALPAVTREVRRGDQLEHRDAFLLPRRATASFATTSAADGQLLRLAIGAEPLPSRAHAVPPRPLEIVAAVNLHGQRALEGGAP